MRSSCEGSSTSSSTIRPTCTCDTPLKPSAGSARSTVCPCGSRMPSFGRIKTRARTLSRPAPVEPGLERLARDPLVRLAIERARALDHVVGQRGRRRRLVPAGARGPVAHVLLVERGLRAARRVAVGGPEAGGVRRQYFVADHDPARFGVAPELELGVGEDDAAPARVVGGELVEGDRAPPQLLERAAVTEHLGGAVEVDVLVVVADL